MIPHIKQLMPEEQQTAVGMRVREYVKDMDGSSL
jgi:hypothetical protein